MIAAAGQRWKGVVGSQGAASGSALVSRPRAAAQRRKVSPAEVSAERARLREAARRAQQRLQTVIDEGAEDGAQRILEAHALMAADEMFLGEALALIEREGASAEWCLERVARTLSEALSQSAAPYLREKADDVAHVLELIESELAGAASVSRFEGPTILIAQTIAPCTLIQLAKNGLAGVVLEGGSRSGHASLVARALGLPMLVGVAGLTEQVTDGQRILCDACEGIVVLEPSAGEEETARALAHSQERRASVLADSLPPSAQRGTRDGVAVRVQANVELPAEAQLAAELGAQGIGLFRSEFLALEARRLPSEEEMDRALQALQEAFPEERLTVRSFDFGGDKPPPGKPAAKERGVRWTLAYPEVLRAQLRAVLRASARGPVRLLLPMVSTAQEVARVRLWLDEEQTALGLGVDVPVGAMVETPLAALDVAALSGVSDFLSVGTNDLLRGLYTSDRHTRLRPGDRLAPRFLELLRRVATATENVTICGDLACDLDALPLLVGAGFRAFSVPPRAVPEVCNLIGKLEVPPCDELFARALEQPSGDAVVQLLRRAQRDP